MSKSYQFFSFIEYNNAYKTLMKLRREGADEELAIEAQNNVIKIIYTIKKQYHLGHNQFNVWVKANEEFLRMLTKEERLALRQATDEATTIELLRSMDYSEIIENYLQDFDPTLLED